MIQNKYSNKYSQEEKDIITKHYPNGGVRKVREFINRSSASIRCKASKMGIVINPRVKSKLAKANNYRRPITLKHVDGRLVTYSSITAFAKKHHIGKTHISQILNGGDVDRIKRGRDHRIFHKGWYDPALLNHCICLLHDDDKFYITNIGDWLVQSGMETSMFFKLLEGKIKYYLGFRLSSTPKLVQVWENRNLVERRPKGRCEYTLLSPKGKIFKTDSLGKIARIAHLNRRGFYYLGTRFSHYKGWKLIEVKELVDKLV